MIPYGVTITSSFVNTLFLSLILFLNVVYTHINEKGINNFFDMFLPKGCPLALAPLLVPIEVISYVFRVVSLSIRLFANMMAGHTLLKVIGGFS
jgi:ATP synthase subunit 6